MKYSDLVQFEPVETVIQLREADSADYARQLVDTFVISDRMAEHLADLVIPQLQFQKPADNKGLLVVGNYGTGKSHLMAVISAVAEHADLGSSLTHPDVAASGAAIAGRFKVIRAEIGAVEMSLRDIITGYLTEGLAEMGVSYEFPDASTIKENKTSFAQMMAAFQEEYPDQGLLLVLDELLDYLRSRKDQDLVLDLNFLREVGEICKGTRFRFMSGVQESLFDNPRFQFVAESLKRVKDRFEQVRIVREDVAYVVSQRLLKKDDKQRALIREHLEQFTPLYGSMSERLDDFVDLYPVHPAYLDTFERVIHAEKREVLKTLSAAMKDIIGETIPAAEPGIIAYDSYWQNLRDNPAFRAVPQIKEVSDKTADLESRIKQSYTRPQYKPAALRIIHALAVHRLTTSDVYSPLGTTAEELRDDLCLVLPTPEQEAGFLKTLVETVLQEITRTVSGQYLSLNPENGQYYLDLKKDIDFDALIEKKAEMLDDNELDRYYFDALRRVVLEDPTLSPYVTGYRIWEHEVEWQERRAGRSGYLFFGAPNERSTAQPPRDFYLYFLQPFDTPYFKDEEKADEVFFRLKSKDETFDKTLRLYGAAMELSAAASGSNKKIHSDKADAQLKALTQWLREHLTTAFEVVYRGDRKTLAEAVQGKVAGQHGAASVRDLVDLASSSNLAGHFADQSPDYPTFSVHVTRKNRSQSAEEALRWIGGSVRSKQGAAVLDALELLDGDKLQPHQSRYAKAILDKVSTKSAGAGTDQVVNRSELITEEYGVEYWEPFRIEPEFLAVVLASLVHAGDIVLSVPGKTFDAAGIDALATSKISDLAAFKHIKPPKDLPVAPLKELFSLLGLPPGLVANPASRDEAVTQLQGRVGHEVSRVVQALAQFPELRLWGKPLLSETTRDDWQGTLTGWKQFLESLQAFNAPGKLKNFPHSVTDVTAQQLALDEIGRVEELLKLAGQLQPLASYLSTAEALLPAGNEWRDGAVKSRAGLLEQIESEDVAGNAGLRRELASSLRKLKKDYAAEYVRLHSRARLNANGERKKTQLAGHAKLKALRTLAVIELTPGQQLRDLENALLGLKACYSLTDKDLEGQPFCPHCDYRPADESGMMIPAGGLEELEERLEQLYTEWEHTLLNNLEDPTVKENIALIGDKKGRATVEQFAESGALPDKLDQQLIKALQEVFSGLEKVVISEGALHKALTAGGMPCTVEELKDRFEAYLAKIVKGHDVAKTRVVIGSGPGAAAGSGGE